MFIAYGIIQTSLRFDDSPLALIATFGQIFNVLLAFTNGYITSSCFGNAPTLVENELKGKAGSSISLFLILGIFGGSIYANQITQKLIS